jgi:serine/threonine protein kinase
MNIKTVDTLCMGCFTELEAGGGVCPVCGYDNAEQVTPLHQLPPRTILNGKYLLGRVLGEGGFGITYIGWDLNLDIKVAIKEYYPLGFVTRESTYTHTVQPLTGSQGEFFAKGRERFVDEAKRLAKFRSLPGIVTANDFFIENGTAYISMEYIEGQTLKSYLSQMGGKLPAAQVFDMMRPVLTSLGEVHKTGMIHRDISPDNIMISREGFVKLLDFGAAREFTDSGNKSLSILLKPGFAPEEQYRSRGKQGPWTDIYALCATMYRAITGVTPDESSERMHVDEVKLPSALGVIINPAQERALMKGMAVLQQNRWQNIGELSAAMYGATTAQAAFTAPLPATEPASPPAEPISKPATPTPEPKPARNPKSSWISSHKPTAIIAVCLVVIGIAGIIFLSNNITIGGQTVDVDVTELTLPSRDISDIGSLARLTNLKELYLGENNISDISALAELTNLKEISLYQNNISDISALEGLTDLEQLYLNENDISDISALEGLTDLNWLNLSYNNISDVSALKGLTNLTTLHLYENPLTKSQVDELEQALPNCDISF